MSIVKRPPRSPPPNEEEEKEEENPAYRCIVEEAPSSERGGASFVLLTSADARHGDRVAIVDARDAAELPASILPAALPAPHPAVHATTPPLLLIFQGEAENPLLRNGPLHPPCGADRLCTARNGSDAIEEPLEEDGSPDACARTQSGLVVKRLCPLSLKVVSIQEKDTGEVNIEGANIVVRRRIEEIERVVAVSSPLQAPRHIAYLAYDVDGHTSAGVVVVVKSLGEEGHPTVGSFRMSHAIEAIAWLPGGRHVALCGAALGIVIVDIFSPKAIIDIAWPPSVGSLVAVHGVTCDHTGKMVMAMVRRADEDQAALVRVPLAALAPPCGSGTLGAPCVFVGERHLTHLRLSADFFRARAAATARQHGTASPKEAAASPTGDAIDDEQFEDAPGIDLRDSSVIWETVGVPVDTFLRGLLNGPIRAAAVDGGEWVAVAGRRGFALYNRHDGTWTTFGDAREEASFVAEQIVWLPMQDDHTPPLLVVLSANPAGHDRHIVIYSPERPLAVRSCIYKQKETPTNRILSLHGAAPSLLGIFTGDHMLQLVYVSLANKDATLKVSLTIGISLASFPKGPAYAFAYVLNSTTPHARPPLGDDGALPRSDGKAKGGDAEEKAGPSATSEDHQPAAVESEERQQRQAEHIAGILLVHLNGALYTMAIPRSSPGAGSSEGNVITPRTVLSSGVDYYFLWRPIPQDFPWLMTVMTDGRVILWRWPFTSEAASDRMESVGAVDGAAEAGTPPPSPPLPRQSFVVGPLAAAFGGFYPDVAGGGLLVAVEGVAGDAFDTGGADSHRLVLDSSIALLPHLLKWYLACEGGASFARALTHLFTPPRLPNNLDLFTEGDVEKSSSLPPPPKERILAFDAQHVLHLEFLYLAILNETPSMGEQERLYTSLCKHLLSLPGGEALLLHSVCAFVRRIEIGDATRIIGYLGAFTALFAVRQPAHSSPPRLCLRTAAPRPAS